jgi:citrate lyase subunit beta/citryl-CoA lyase
MSARTRDLPRRSCLSIPGSSEKMLAKGPTIPADMKFLDMEDSVSPLEKELAREKVVKAIREQDWGDCVLCVRINAWDSPWTTYDIVEVVGGAGERLEEVMLPKVQTAAEVVATDLLLTQVEKASPRLETIILGPVDFSASMEMPDLRGGTLIPEYPGDYFHYVFMKILMAGRANGLQVIDGPYVKVRDPEGFKEFSRRAYTLGFDGKWALHPDQVTLLNELFSPTQEDFDKALDVLTTYEEATTTGERKGAVMFGDEMIDEASRKVAAKIKMRGERNGMVHS